MLRNRTATLGIGLLLAAACLGARAVPVPYDFRIAWQSGALAGSVSEGSFAFDSSLSASTGFVLWGPGMLSSLDFTLRGVRYDATSANTGAISFDAQRRLVSIVFGNRCESVSCSVTSGREDEWWFNWHAAAGRQAVTGDAPDGLSSSLDLTVTPRAPVPEPAGWLLGPLGLAVLAWARSRHRGHAADAPQRLLRRRRRPPLPGV
ncbi:MAG: hypothetical protein JNL87_08695 [Burkholderiaceae bacterium]|nr:hypothetical protein [Burkholderiaceae bacterium]